MVLYLVIDWLWLKQSLFWISVEHSKILREKYLSKGLDLVCLVWSEFGDKYAIGIVLCVSFNFLDMPKGFIMTVVTATC